MKDDIIRDAPHEDGELAKLKLEKEILAQQVKGLVKAEGKLYEYQEKLDAQLKEYQNLYELSRKLNTSFDIGNVFEYAVNYVINNLEYERVLIFRQSENSGDYAVSALDGYYSEEEKNSVSSLIVKETEPFLSFLQEGSEFIICSADTEEKSLADYRVRMLMDEYLICPLISGARPFALLALGNSAGNAEFYRRVSDDEESLLGIGNLVGLLSSSMENHISYSQMERALEQEKRAEAKYRSIFENALEGIFQMTIDGRLLSANPAIARMLAYDSPEELISSLTDLGHQIYVRPSDREKILSALLEKGEVLGKEAQFCRKDKQKIWVSISARTVLDDTGKPLILEGLIADITERKKAEEALKKAHIELEQRVKERTIELSTANKQLRQRHLESSILYKVSSVISRSIHMDTLLAEVLNTISGLEVFDTKKAGIFVIEGDTMKLVAHLGHSEAFLDLHKDMKLGDCLCGIVAETGEPIISKNSAKDNRHTIRYSDMTPHGHLIVPLKAKDRVIGVLYLYMPADVEIDEDKLKLLLLIGNQLGISIENARLYEETKALSLHDPLTSLWNHEEILRILEQELVRAKREGTNVGVIMADLDHFKRINDTYGHPAGDKVLRSTAKKMLSLVRPYDAVGRYGGEEFLIVLPGCNENCTSSIAERLCATIGSKGMDIPHGTVAVTVSIGFAISSKEKRQDLNSIVHAADSALYKAKKNGRNRVEIASDH